MKLASHEASFMLFGRGEKMPNLIKKLRLEKGYTQEALSKKVGVTSRTIISLVNGKYKPSLILAYKLACFLGTDVETLFCLREYVGG